ncbi:hypothetical protein ACTXT7_014751 [Hymenolepis weldensis]
MTINPTKNCIPPIIEHQPQLKSVRQTEFISVDNPETVLRTPMHSRRTESVLQRRVNSPTSWVTSGKFSKMKIMLKHFDPRQVLATSSFASPVSYVKYSLVQTDTFASLLVRAKGLNSPLVRVLDHQKYSELLGMKD